MCVACTCPLRTSTDTFVVAKISVLTQWPCEFSPTSIAPCFTPRSCAYWHWWQGRQFQTECTTVHATKTFPSVPKHPQAPQVAGRVPKYPLPPPSAPERLQVSQVSADATKRSQVSPSAPRDPKHHNVSPQARASQLLCKQDLQWTLEPWCPG